MTPTTVTTTAEQIATSGPISPAFAMVVGLGLSLLFAGMLWRERPGVAAHNVILFWSLRTIALGVTLWMLLAPTKVLVETSTTRKAIVFVTDVSGSMQTIDPAGASDDFRWALAGDRTENDSTTREADEAVAAMGVAQRQLKQISESLARRHERATDDAIAAASEALQHARNHLAKLNSPPAARSASSRSQSLMMRLTKLLDGAELQSFTQLSTSIKKNRSPSQKGWQEGLPDLEHRFSVIKSALQELAQSTAVDEEPQRANENSTAATSQRNVSRLAKVANSISALQPGSLNALKERVDVRFASFDQSVHWITGEPSSTKPLPDDPASTPAGTDIAAVFEALQKERQHQPCAGVFLLSDVAHNQFRDKSPLDIAASLTGTPVYVIPIGNTQHVRDLRLRSVFAPTVAMRNDDIVVEASIQAFECEGESCIVQLLQDGKTIDQREISFDTGLANRTVRFERQVPTVGTERFRVSVVPIEGEVSTDINDRDFEVNVTRSDIKILLADEFPRWEYRYLTHLFRRDSKVECDEMLYHPRVIATGHRQSSNSLPVTIEEWDQYDVVILGDLPAERLPITAQESLVQYLQQHGGTLVVIAGQDAMPQAFENQPLCDILPVTSIDRTTSAGSTSYELKLTPEGIEHQALMIGETEEENRVAWDLVNLQLPLPTISNWRRPRATARTLISAIAKDSKSPTEDAANSAFLCWQPVGRGRIVYLSGPDTYHLRFLRGDRLHYRFWGQLLRWAIAADLGAGTNCVRIRTEKSRYEPHESVMVTVRLANDRGEPVITSGVTANVTGDQETRTILLNADPQVPGEYHGEIRSLSPGNYQIVPAGDAVKELLRDKPQEQVSASVSVQNPQSSELIDTRCDRALALQIADVTGGQVLPPTAIKEILELTDLEPIIAERVEQRPIWVQWKYLWVVFGSLQGEWFIRRRLGLS